MHKKNALAVASGKVANIARGAYAKAAGVGTGLMVAAGSALAGGGGTSPGAAIAGEVSGGSAEMGLVFAGIAVLIGLLVVWAFTRRAAGK